MKKLFIVVLFISAGSVALSQKINASAVPSVVKKAFNNSHPGISPEWEKENGSFEASFKKGKHDMSCVIDNSGTILETETDIPVSELPQEAVIYLKAHYKGHTIREASKVIRKDGSINYEAKVKDTDVMFDKHGKYLNEIKEAND
jgi:hypothetical protein